MSVALVAIMLIAGASFAYKAKTAKSTLDDLVFFSPMLRVTDTVADAHFAPATIPNIAAINSMLADLGPAWSVAMELRTGRPTLIEGGAIPWIPGPANTLSWQSFGASCSENACIPVETVEALARQFLKRYPEVFMMDGYDLVIDRNGSGPVWNSIYLLRFQPYYKGVMMKGASVIFRINNGNLIQVVVDKVGKTPMDSTPVLNPIGAWSVMYGNIGGEGEDRVIEDGTLEFVPVTPRGLDPEVFNGQVGSMLEYALVWRLSFQRLGVTGTWEALVDARSGELLQFADANRYGHIHGGIRPSDGMPPEENRPFPWADTGQASPNNYSDGAGNFTGNNATSHLVGKYAHISDACGAISNTTTTGDLNFLVDNAAGTDCVVPAGNTAGLGNTHSSRTLYYNLTAINLKAQIYNPSNTWLTSTYITANVNGSATCNASSGGGVVNFYKHVAGSCNNLGEIPGVAMHEWAHSYDDQDGSGADTPPLETYADWTAIIQTHNSCTGAGFFIGSYCGGYGDPCLSCTGVRDCDYTQHQKNTPWTSSNYGTTWSGCDGGSYFGPCGKEDHCESGISTQALWDFVYRDLTDACPGGPMCNNGFTPLDITSAWMLEDRLWFTGVQTMTSSYTCSGMVTSGCSGTVLYSVMRALDDDGDGTANGTPHAHAIYHAMQRHLIHCNTWNDTSAQNQNQTSCPSLTTPTLTIVAGNNQAILNWTTGGASATRYFVYRNESGCDVAFNRIAIVNAPTLTYTDNGVVNGTTYYYRIQAVTANDSCVSPSSGCQTGTPQPCAASISLDKTVYNCADTVNVSVLDSTPGTSPWSGTAWSASDPTPRAFTLVNNPSGSATYTGTFTTTTGAGGAGVVHVVAGDTLTVRFLDRDYCGVPNTNVDKTATVDCTAPIISNVAVTNVTGNSALVTWTTNESANSRVTYGTATPPGTNKDDLTTYVTSHSLSLTGLTECTPYFFSVRSVDPAGNAATDTNSGAYYTFSTGKNTQPTYASTDVPVTIDGSVTHTSTLTVTDTKVIQDLNVNLTSLTHVYVGDVEVRLIGPDATTVLLADNRGGSGDNFTNTVFDDEAATAISAGSPPFTGSFRPEAVLTAFDGKIAAGTWTLQIIDTYPSADDGTLNAWGLTFTYPAAACGPHAKYNAHAAVADDCPAGGAGDANGVWEAGETVQFSVTLENDGTVPLTGVSVTLTPLTAGVVMTDGTATYTNIAVGATGTSQVPHFTAVLPDSLACGSTVQFSVSIATGQGSWSGDIFTHGVGTVIPGIFTILDEDFEGTWGPNGNVPPAGWTIEDHGSVPGTWNANDWSKYVKGGAYGSVARVYYSPLENQDEWLITPAFDLPAGATAAALEFDHYFYWYSSTDFGYVDYQSDQHPAWTTLVTYSTTTGTSTVYAHATVNLSGYAGDTNVRVRFRYVGYNGWQWEVDNVQVAGTQPGTCDQTVCAASGPNVQYDGSYNPVASLMEVCGDGDAVVEPGEDWRVTVRLKNAGTSQATATVADLAVNAGTAVDAVILAGNPGAFGTLSAGGTATDAYDFRVDAGAVCANDITFDMINLSSTETSYPPQPAVFAVPVGIVSAGGNETATQVTTPLNATSATADSALAAAFTLAAADAATVDYAFTYAGGGAGQVLFGPDDFAGIAGWTVVGYAQNGGSAHCGTHSDALARTPASNGTNTYTMTLTVPISTVGYTNITVGMDWYVQEAGQTQYLDWSTNGTAWTLGAATTTATTWQCGQSQVLPAGAAGQPTLYIRFRTVSTTRARAYVDYVRVTGDGAGGSWTANVRTQLVAPDATVLTLKDYGTVETSPASHDVAAFYTAEGPGGYTLRIIENAGGAATVTGGSMNVVMNPTSHCAVSSCGSTAPPPVRDTGAGAAKFTKGSGNTLTVTYDAATCSSEKLIILYGGLNDFTGYGGCAQDNGGNAGTTTINSTGHTATWYNLVWTQGTTAGHPGFATGGGRSWNVGTLCGMTDDDQSKTTCP